MWTGENCLIKGHTKLFVLIIKKLNLQNRQKLLFKKTQSVSLVSFPRKGTLDYQHFDKHLLRKWFISVKSTRVTIFLYKCFLVFVTLTIRIFLFSYTCMSNILKKGRCDDICLIRNITLVSTLNSHTVLLDYFPLHMSGSILIL